MVSNNSSGMCCGVSQNTYHTLQDMRIVFADGSVLDTADDASRKAFREVPPPPHPITRIHTHTHHHRPGPSLADHTPSQAEAASP